MTGTVVTITRHFSGFRNVADRFRVGEHEGDGNASADRYHLPAGYSVNEGRNILDPDGVLCAIVADDDGNGPILISLVGPHPDVRLTKA